MITKYELQQALDGLTKANIRAARWREIVMEYSRETFGVEPGAVNCDAFIDAVDNGCGVPSGMTADEFISAMETCLQLFNE